MVGGVAELFLPGWSLEWLSYLSRVGLKCFRFLAGRVAGAVELSFPGWSLEWLSYLSRAARWSG